MKTKDKSSRIIKFLCHELDLPSYSLGSEVGKAFVDPVGGLAFIQSIFEEIPGIEEEIKQIGDDIKKCNSMVKLHPSNSCVNRLKERRVGISQKMKDHGMYFNWDVFDNFWDKLPGD